MGRVGTKCFIFNHWKQQKTAENSSSQNSQLQSKQLKQLKTAENKMSFKIRAFFTCALVRHTINYLVPLWWEKDRRGDHKAFWRRVKRPENSHKQACWATYYTENVMTQGNSYRRTKSFTTREMYYILYHTKNMGKLGFASL